MLPISKSRLIPPKTYTQNLNKGDLGDIVTIIARGTRPAVIRYVTESPLTHVGMLIDSNKILEITSGFPKVHISTLESKLKIPIITDVCILKIKPEIRQKLQENKEQFRDIAMKIMGKPFLEITELLKLALNKKLGIFTIADDAEHFSCSKLIGFMLKNMEIIPKGTNVTKLTPKDIANLPIYTDKIILKQKN